MTRLISLFKTIISTPFFITPKTDVVLSFGTLSVTRTTSPATLNQDKFFLNWETSQEINNSHFT